MAYLTKPKHLYIHVNDEKGIVDAVEFSKSQGLSKTVIVGGYEAYKIASYLKEHNIAVLLQRVHSRPNNDDHDYDLPFKMAHLLVDAGVTSGIRDQWRYGTNEFSKPSVLCRHHSGTWTYKSASASIDNIKYCSNSRDRQQLWLSGEWEKVLRLFISTGDALDMRTNNLTTCLY